MPTRYVIVGQGVAGIAAAEAIRASDAAGQITLISDDPYGYYSRPGLAYYLTGEIQRAYLFPWRDEEFQNLNVRRVQGQAVGLDPAAHCLHLADGGAVPYDRLLLATGAAAVRPTIPGIDLPQVVKLDNLADAERILALARKARVAVVVGGGITALEIVEGLREHCRHVHYLLRGERYWSNVLDETESRIVLERLTAEGVQIHTHTELAAVEEKTGRVAAVLTTTGQRIPCDLVAVAIGVAPRAELAHAAGLRVDRGVLVDETLRSSAQDIYAAGDVAQVFDPRAGKALLDTLWNSARSHGSAAGNNMAGASQRYVKPMPLNVTRLAGLTTTIIGSVGSGRDADLIGIARGDSELWRQLGQALVAEDEHEVNRLRLLVGQSTLVGAVLMGDQRLSLPLQRLISEQTDITSIRAQLLAPNAPLAALLAGFADGDR
jgi:NADPH-dependent 2,4-dienoyl-CoA reductase/sulfur reductase-like enzyme